MSATEASILVADDHALVAAGIRKLLLPRYRVIGVAHTGSELLQMALERRPDVVLTDISMPDVDGIEATRRIHASLPSVPIIVLTMFEGAGYVKAAFEAGASGYLLKNSVTREVFDAIETVLGGGTYWAATVAGTILGSLLIPESNTAKPLLTKREAEVSSLVGRGLENAEIAQHLCIAEVTVRSHFLNILRKLGLRNRVELARHALIQGWASLETRPVSVDGPASSRMAALR